MTTRIPTISLTLLPYLGNTSPIKSRHKLRVVIVGADFENFTQSIESRIKIVGIKQQLKQIKKLQSLIIQNITGDRQNETPIQFIISSKIYKVDQTLHLQNNQKRKIDLRQFSDQFEITYYEFHYYHTKTRPQYQKFTTTNNQILNNPKFFKSLQCSSLQIDLLLDSLSNMKIYLPLLQNKILHLKVNAKIKQSQVTNDHVQILASKIKSLKNLESLILDLSQVTISNEEDTFYLTNHFINDKSMKAISKAVSNLKKIKNLSISNASNKVDSQSFHHLCQQISNLNQVKHLVLNFSSTFAISNFKQLDLDIQTKLKSLTLGFGSSLFQKNNKQLRKKNLELVQQQFFELEKLTLIAPFNQESTSFLPYFQKCINLREVKMDFSCVDWSKLKFEQLMNSLQNSKNIQRLNLKFQACRISDEHCNSLDSLIVNLPMLRSFSLKLSSHLMRLSSCNKISDEGLNKILQALNQKEDLYKLKFNLSSTITNNGLNNLFQTISNLPKLGKLTLITQQKLILNKKYFEESDLQNLQFLSLSANFSDEGNILVFQQIRYLRNLRHLHLKCISMKDSMETKMSILSDSLLLLKNLEIISFCFEHLGQGKFLQKILNGLLSVLINKAKLRKITFEILSYAFNQSAILKLFEEYAQKSNIDIYFYK